MNLEKKQIREQARREIIRHFVKFLKEKRVYIKYKENIMYAIISPTQTSMRLTHYKNYVGFTYGLQTKVLKEHNTNKVRPLTISLAQELINYAFCWDDTPQRHEFWYKLSEEWRKYVKQHFEQYANLIG